MTVGYGDFAPPDVASRLVSTAMMVVLVLFIPTELASIVEAARRNREFCCGSLPSPWHDFIALFGPVSPHQVRVPTWRKARTHARTHARSQPT